MSQPRQILTDTEAQELLALVRKVAERHYDVGAAAAVGPESHRAAQNAAHLAFADTTRWIYSHTEAPA